MKKIIFLSIIGVLLMSMALALEWPIPKAQTCEFFNLTGGACDMFWCQSIKSGTYNISNELCEYRTIVNNTIYVNASNESNQTLVTNITNITIGLNESELIKYFGVNVTNQSFWPYVKEYVDNQSAKYLNASANYVTRDEFDSTTITEKSSGNSGVTIAIVVLFVVIAIFGGIALIKKKQEPTGYYGTPAVPKIQRSQDLEAIERIKKLEERLKRKSEQHQKKEPEKIPDEESIEDLDEDY